MSFLKQAGIGYNKDEFWSGQAIVETKFSVGDMTTARNSKVNSKKKHVGGKAANAANTGMQVNYLAVFFKSATSGSGTTPPVVFDSLTGWGYDETKDTKFSMMERLTLAGRLQSSVNYEGTIPQQRDISVQCGGMCAIRMFTKTPQESVSWMDRLCWTIPDIDDGAKAEQQYRHLTSLARQEFPVGKIPILVEKMSEELYREFPRAAMKHFVDTISASEEGFEYFLTNKPRESKNPLDSYILSNFIAPLRLLLGIGEFLDDGGQPGHLDQKWKSWQNEYVARKLPNEANPVSLKFPPEIKLGRAPFAKTRGMDKAANINFSVIYMNIGLLSWPKARSVLEMIRQQSGSEMIGVVAFITRMESFSDRERAHIMSVSNEALNGQYQCFTHLRDHNFGKALSVAHPGDGLRILFRL
jgi:hypothetical protein